MKTFGYNLDMSRPTGLPKTGGRKAGIPNRETKTLLARCEEEGIDFFAELMKIAKDPAHPRYFDAIKEGCSYLHAKRKAVEVRGDSENEIRLIVEDWTSNKVTKSS